MDFCKQLESIGADFHEPPASEEDVSRIESLIGAQLPADYRRYMLTVPRVHIPSSVYIECSEPTPFGEAHFHSMHSIDEVKHLLDSFLTPRNMVTIATGNRSQYICLSVVGIDKGAVYALDGDYRCFLEDDEFEEWFPAMDDSIRQYLEIRRNDELPEKPFSYSTVYHITDSFSDFIGSLTGQTE